MLQRPTFVASRRPSLKSLRDRSSFRRLHGRARDHCDDHPEITSGDSASTAPSDMRHSMASRRRSESSAIPRSELSATRSPRLITWRYSRLAGCASGTIPTAVEMPTYSGAGSTSSTSCAGACDCDCNTIPALSFTTALGSLARRATSPGSPFLAPGTLSTAFALERIRRYRDLARIRFRASLESPRVAACTKPECQTA